MKKSSNESGRSLLEMIAIFALMMLISLGGLKIYQWAMASHDAAIIHDDLMARGKLNQEGKPGQKKLFATDLFDKNAKKNADGQFVTAARNGKEITASEEADGYYYSYSVGGINEPTCKRLIRQSWAGADRIKVNNTTYKISTGQNTKGQIVGSPECDNTNTIQVTFSKNTGAKGSYIPKTCSNNSNCPASRSCQNGICVDPPSCDGCTADQVCFQGECVTKGGCKKGNCCPEPCSECDQAEDVCTKCQSGYYLVDGVCIECPEYATCDGGSKPFECTAPFLKTLDESGCDCPAGYVLNTDEGTCTLCPAGKVCGGNNTTTPENCPLGSYCPEGTIEPTECDPGKYCPEGSKEPLCYPGYVLSEDDQCEVAEKDSPNAGCLNGLVADGAGSCYCPAGYGLVDGVCSVCTGNTISKANGQCVDCGAGTANSTHTQCACSTNAHQISETDLTCSCNTPFALDNTNHTCYCPAGYGLSGNTCSACTGNTISKAGGYCVDCGAGTANNNHTDCNCYANATHDPNTLLCSCNANHALIGGTCQYCTYGVASATSCYACQPNTRNGCGTAYTCNSSGSCTPCVNQTCGCDYCSNGSGGCMNLTAACRAKYNSNWKADGTQCRTDNNQRNGTCGKNGWSNANSSGECFKWASISQCPY